MIPRVEKYRDSTHLDFRFSRHHYLQGARKLHIVAHSMGNYVLKKALDNLKEKTAQLHAFRSVTRTVTFAAPDVGRNDFKEMVNDLVPGTGNQQLIATLFCSNGDLALLASSLLRIMLDPKNRGYRAGLFRAWRFAGGHRVHPLLLPFRLDTVDASGFANDTFGHGYFANSRSLLAEISHIINSGQRARGRMALAPPPILEVNQSPCFACQGKWFQVRRTVAIKR
jgi:esterase/lipase superfamily enzyme